MPENGSRTCSDALSAAATQRYRPPLSDGTPELCPAGALGVDQYPAAAKRIHKDVKYLTRSRSLSNKSKLLTRIDSRVDASSQLLLILMGLGVTGAVTKFGTELDSSTPPDPLIASTIFGVFLVYSIRFFFNNWVYLSESYHKEGFSLCIR
jgi:hypothetical protein